MYIPDGFFSLFLDSFTENLPRFLWAILVFIIGFYVSKWFGTKIGRILERIGLNRALKRIGWQEALARIELKLDAASFFGEIFRLAVFLLFLLAISEILGFFQFGQFLLGVINYFPNIFIAILIFIAAAFLTDFSQKIVMGSLEAERITYSRFIGKGLSLGIWILAILAILYQLNIVRTLILTTFIGVIFTIALILGISLGLGGKNLAERILKELEEKFKR